MMPPWHVRLWCWVLGHVWATNRRASPVTEFYMCGRCGKLGARV